MSADSEHFALICSETSSTFWFPYFCLNQLGLGQGNVKVQEPCQGVPRHWYCVMCKKHQTDFRFAPLQVVQLYASSQSGFLQRGVEKQSWLLMTR